MPNETPLTDAAPGLLRELRAAHQIILNALVIMTLEQKSHWAALNASKGVAGEGVIRYGEREAAIAQALGVPRL